MNIFSFRAECPHDVKLFLKTINNWPEECTPELIPNHVSERNRVELNEVQWGLPDMGAPDINVEIRSYCTLAELRLVMCGQEDTHIMIETLRQVPLRENNLSRDSSFWPDEGSPEHIKQSKIFDGRGNLLPGLTPLVNKGDSDDGQ